MQLPVEHKRIPSSNEKYEKLIGEVHERYNSCVADFNRSHENLYGFLGLVYESAAIIDNDSALRPALLTEVEAAINANRPKKKKVRFHKRDTLDLLLLLQTKGSKDLVASKSGWLAALHAAKLVSPPVEPTEEAFVEWIKEIGVVGARKLVKSTSDFDLSEFANDVSSAQASFSIELSADAEPPAQLLLILGKVIGRNGDMAEVEPVDIIMNTKKVTAMSAWSARNLDHDAEVHANKVARAINKVRKAKIDPGAPDIVPELEPSDYHDLKDEFEKI